MQDLSFLFLGFGGGAAYAGVALALIITYRSSGVINFAAAALAAYGAVTYLELRQGNIFDPIPGLPSTEHVVSSCPMIVALLLACAITALLSMICYLLIFRPLRHAHALSKCAASVGLMLLIENLVGLKLGNEIPFSTAIFPTGIWRLGGSVVPVDRLSTAAAIAVLTAIVWAFYRFTTFGLHTRAAAETEKGAVVVGLSPDRIALYNWAISGALAAVAGILVSPYTPVDPGTYVLFIVPGLAVALIARFSSLLVALVAGLALGMIQSLLALFDTKAWWPPDLGSSVGDVIPLLAIVVVLVIQGESLPRRGTILPISLPEARQPRHIAATAVVLTGVGVVGLLLLSGGYRQGLITSFLLCFVALSFVVVTGYTGQISFVQLTLAGIGAFFLAHIATVWGVPFPWAPILATAGVVVFGVLLGLPALRVRGMQLGMLTLAAAVAVDALYFNNAPLSGSQNQVTISDPHLFGIDLGIGSGASYPRVVFGFLVLGVLLVACLGVVALRRGRLGHDMLAVRANERAAAAVGINVARTKLVAFGIGALLAGIAGSLMAYQSGQVSPEPFLTLNGVFFFVIVYLAGSTSISGALVAGVIGPLGLLAIWLNRLVNFGSYYEIITAFALIMTMVQHPEGMVGAFQSMFEKRRSKKDAADRLTRQEEAAAVGAVVTQVAVMAE